MKAVSYRIIKEMKFSESEILGNDVKFSKFLKFLKVTSNSWKFLNL